MRSLWYFTQGKAAAKLVLRMAAKATALFRVARPSSSLIDYSRRKGRTWPHRDRDGAWRGRVRLRHQPQRRSVVRTVKHFPSKSGTPLAFSGDWPAPDSSSGDRTAPSRQRGRGMPRPSVRLRSYYSATKVNRKTAGGKLCPRPFRPVRRDRGSARSCAFRAPRRLHPALRSHGAARGPLRQSRAWPW